MKRSTTAMLGYALLGLLQQKSRSGYDLRKIFADTATGNYSSSPGAIYPALQRLEVDELIHGKVEETAGLRRRRLYHITDTGQAALKLWLAKPIQPNDVQRGAGELMLRFGFMEQVLGPSACIHFLGNFGKALEPYIAELEAFLSAQAGSMSLSSQLALESGIRGYRGLHEWTGYALEVYRQSQSCPSPSPAKSNQGGSS
jgi:DNA-binding PadR family transcriptional regulator